ncbi:radiation-inducible immediate-early gene IEX-1 [Trichosurus vulpecula]|uniref:radiation-inducible immediate-early gene IEX-1 n=1 Tax=Trichosurus vulpecula TaxID=9337 RepID=UPI00186B0D49|nr:radiation-inducible immediate-early gene IEX-1 [Trichosurus vulpecula]
MCHNRASVPAAPVTLAPTPGPIPSPGRRRRSGPEIFTFDPLPEPATYYRPARSSFAHRVIRKRSRRVLYPQMVRRQPPAEDPNPARRLLFLLLTIVFCQILMAEEGGPAPPVLEEPPNDPTPAPPVVESQNLTSEPPDYTVDISALLQQHPAAF